MPTMPNCVGLEYEAALLAMVDAGVRVLPLGYFVTDPVVINWQYSATYAPNVVTAQDPASSTTVTANSDVTLTVSNLPISVAYPAGGSQT